MLPKAVYTISRNDEIGKYTLEDEYSQILEGANLSEVFREIEDREADEGMNLEEPEIHELEF